MPLTDQLRDDILKSVPSLRAFAISLSGSGDRADDLVQETLLRAIAHIDSFQPGSNLPAWLFTILRNLHLSAERQRQRRGPHLDVDAISPPGAAATQEAGLEMQDVLAALDQLPEEQKSLLLLVGVEDLSYDDAARVLGVPPGTVMSRLSRGRQRLRSILETGRVRLLRRVK